MGMMLKSAQGHPLCCLQCYELALRLQEQRRRPEALQPLAAVWACARDTFFQRSLLVGGPGALVHDVSEGVRKIYVPFCSMNNGSTAVQVTVE